MTKIATANVLVTKCTALGDNNLYESPELKSTLHKTILWESTGVAATAPLGEPAFIQTNSTPTQMSPTAQRFTFLRFIFIFNHVRVFV